jgi:hypothetical protein
MSAAWRARFDQVLREGEVVGLYFTTAMLIIVEFCFVYWLQRIQIPEAASNVSPGFCAMPPWYQKPRFEVTLLLTILAGLLFSLCWALWDLWRRKTDRRSWETALQSVKQRSQTATSVAALTGVELALVTWLRG